jgi:hypothetical protein
VDVGLHGGRLSGERQPREAAAVLPSRGRRGSPEMQDGDGTFSFKLLIRVLAKMEVLLAIFQE